MLTQLYTRQGETLSGTPWQIYPRPQLRRDSFLCLNGIWEFAVSADKEPPERFDRSILVPFCPESALSGVGEHFPEGSYLFYRRRLALPAGFFRGRVLLHIGAADQELDCFVGGAHAGRHLGGYEAMTFDITPFLPDGEAVLLLRVRDDLRDLSQPYGKQVAPKKRGGMWYTPVSGIYQSVWLESVPETYIERLDIQTDCRRAVIDTGQPTIPGRVLLENGQAFPLEKGRAVIAPENPRLWSPEDPWLYAFTLEMGEDRVESYFALRTVDIRQVAGIPRICLNGEPYFFHGLLDQGYWPDGLLTAPDPGCYAQDIQAMKELGFNTLRKHIKVEPEEFYYQCDRLGMVVFQDMVNNGQYRYLRDTALPTVGFQVRPDGGLHRDPKGRETFYRSMEATVRQLRNHPCILYWTIFNEGWGQFRSTDAYRRLKALDGSRIIDTASGWFRWGQTDVNSRHIYFGPWGQLRKSKRPLVLSEFGGYTLPTPGHMANTDDAYGYRTCRTREQYMTELLALYRQRIEPAIPKGLCGAIYTQLSDVEDEINGLLTYDRKVLKADPAAMATLAARLTGALQPGGVPPRSRRAPVWR